MVSGLLYYKNSTVHCLTLTLSKDQYLLAMTDNIWRLDIYLPPGIYFIVNPYQESHGVVAQLLGAVKSPIIFMQPTLVYIPSTVLYRRNILGVLFVLLYFGLGRGGYTYSAVLCRPFGNTDGYHEQINTVKNASDRAAVPHEWTQVILFCGVNSTH